MQAVVAVDDMDGAVDAEYGALFTELTRFCQALGAGGSAEDSPRTSCSKAGLRRPGQGSSPV